MKLTNHKIVYSINVADLQTVAQDTLARKLTDNEISLVSDCIGDYINWVQVIENALEQLEIEN